MKKKFLLVVCVMLILVNFLGCGNRTDEISNADFAKQNKLDENFVDELVTGFVTLGFQLSDVQNFRKTSDWAGGKRYTFNAKENQYYIYADTTGTILVSINGYTDNGNKKLYEPRKNDYETNIEVGETPSPTPETVPEPTGESLASKYTYYIEANELGAYGKYVEMNGKQYIFYYVPAGEYAVSSFARGNIPAILYVCKNELITNSSGYQEETIVQIVRDRTDGGEYIEIKEDEHISVTDNCEFFLMDKLMFANLD
jgi:hypothetical protein